MDFFQHQDDARRRTGWLVVLFILAVIVIIALVYAVVVAFVAWTAARSGPGHPGQASPLGTLLWDPRLLAGVCIGVVALVGGASAYKIARLAGGGEVVASSLGGRPLSTDTTDPDGRKLLNVVEEMAIASGTPVPPVYLLENEAGINAFAAGYTPGQAVIGVTRGAIQQLSRDELQGVIAHEFSHIFSGDMRLNIRLIGVIYGILVIGLIGYVVLRAAGYGALAGRRSSRNNNTLPLLALGLALIVIGYAGTFFGRLIKAAVSRQREFLADASAVQFTRYPAGLAGALKQIGGYGAGSRLATPHVEQASHMLFGQGLSLSSLMATHPPLPERIRRIEPGWDGELPQVQVAAADPGAEPGRAPMDGRTAGLAPSMAQRISQARRSAVEHVGDPTAEHLDYAAQLLASLPAPLRDAAREPYGSRAVVFALLLDSDPAIRGGQMQRLRSEADRHVYDLAARWSAQVAQLPPQTRLPLLDLAIPALRQLSPDQYRQFEANVNELIRADEQVNLFEWTLRRVLLRHLAPHFTRVTPPRIRYHKLRPLADPLATLLSTLAHVGHADPAAGQRAFEAGLRQTGMELTLKPKQACGLHELDAALDAFAAGSPGIKKRVLRACAVCIEADAAVAPREAELLRAIADSLDCPMPPLLPGQRMA